MKLNLVALCLVTLLPATAGATTVRLHTEPEMVRGATAIVRGTVVSIETRYDKRGMIVTDVTIQVARLLKAKQSRPTVTFTQLGGTLDGRALKVAGTSSYAQGEEVLVFLEDGGNSLVEMGVGAGKFRIDRGTGRPLVLRQLRGLNFMRYIGRRSEPAPPPRVGEPEPLDVLEARILGYLAE